MTVLDYHQSLFIKDMNTLFSLKTGWVFALYVFLDILCTGLGMGVPIFCIFLGLPVGWYITKRITASPLSTREILSKVLLWAALASAFTFVLMALLWGSSVAMLVGSATDLANYGIPMILYDPVASFIGWLVLMIVISPALQFLMALLGSHLTWLWELSRSAQRIF